tara:strand:- start:414 stop:623 length:210 start_codon:yes stop_codon:yes gene_type:complete
MTKLSIIRGSVSQLTGANKKDFSGNMIKVNILKQEVEHLKTLLQPTDTGHLHTTISVLEDRIKELENEK